MIIIITLMVVVLVVVMVLAVVSTCAYVNSNARDSYARACV